MKKMKFSGQYTDDKNSIRINVSVFQFKEDNIVILYSPAFDLSGYGLNLEEAKDSFKETLSYFLEYTTKKKTLIRELKKLGWKIHTDKRKTQKIQAPELSELILNRNFLTEILNEKSFKKSDVIVEVPVP